jgi:hypothetical protein
MASDEQPLAILATLEECQQCQAALVTNGNPETAHLVSVAALDVRMKLSGIGEDELIALCEEMMPIEIAAEGVRGGRSVGASAAPTRAAASRQVVEIWVNPAHACGAVFVIPQPSMPSTWRWSSLVRSARA